MKKKILQVIHLSDGTRDGVSELELTGFIYGARDCLSHRDSQYKDLGFAASLVGFY